MIAQSAPRADAARAAGITASPGCGERSAADAVRAALSRFHQSFQVRPAGDASEVLAYSGTAAAEEAASSSRTAFVPALHPSQLGDSEFRKAHGLRYAYIAGEMANAIGSEEIVEAMARAGMVGFFGAAGCSLERVEAAIDRVQRSLRRERLEGWGTDRSTTDYGDSATTGDQCLPYGFNLIHSPAEPSLEDAVVDLYLRRGVRLVCASAYLDLTLPLIRYRAAGVHTGPDGEIVAPNRLIAKVSRVEVARKFFSPPPAEMLAALVQSGVITRGQAELAGRIPVAQDLTAEADSGGHTDNRPAITLIPTMLAMRDAMMDKHDYAERLRVGAAGGIATPAAAAAAFAMGAAYVLTGSINQACVEAGTSDAVREMLAAAEQADVMMAPAADMFEMGVNVQVLKRGTMFPLRARKLYELYRTYGSLEELPDAERAKLEREFFRKPLAQVWNDTAAFFARRDPRQIERAERDSRHKMALVFRSYLGLSSKWANSGEPSRKLDYQVWCGPAMGAFNEWTRGTFLEKPANRSVVTVALNLMAGAAVLTRATILRSQGIAPRGLDRFAPMPLDELERSLA